MAKNRKYKKDNKKNYSLQDETLKNVSGGNFSNLSPIISPNNQGAFPNWTTSKNPAINPLYDTKLSMDERQAAYKRKLANS